MKKLFEIELNQMFKIPAKFHKFCHFRSKGIEPYLGHHLSSSFNLTIYSFNILDYFVSKDSDVKLINNMNMPMNVNWYFIFLISMQIR